MANMNTLSNKADSDEVTAHPQEKISNHKPLVTSQSNTMNIVDNGMKTALKNILQGEEEHDHSEPTHPSISRKLQSENWFQVWVGQAGPDKFRYPESRGLAVGSTFNNGHRASNSESVRLFEYHVENDIY